jgi:hypothetical protein
MERTATPAVKESVTPLPPASARRSLPVQLSAQVRHALDCHKKLEAAQRQLDRANRELNNAMVRIPDADMVDYYLATAK